MIAFIAENKSKINLLVIKIINIILEIMKEFMVHVQEVLFHQENLLMLKEKEQIHAQKHYL